MLTFLLGGARCGKSTLAVQMGEHFGGPVTMVATAEPFDDELRDRIARHRDERPAAWTTIEEPLDLAAAVRVAADSSMLVVDCLTVWVANMGAREASGDEMITAIRGFVDELKQRRLRGAAPTVIVSNEVGMGIVPADELTRAYRDDLGRLNQMVAAVSDTTLLVVAGRALRLDSAWELLR